MKPIHSSRRKAPSNCVVAAILTGLLCAGSASTQVKRPLAITNARIVTMEGKTIDMGMVLIRDGKIEAVGAKVKVPAGAKIIDAKGGTLMPGLVHAWSRAGLDRKSRPTQRIPFGRRGRGRRGRSSSSRRGGSGRNSAATKVAHAIYPRQDVFHELLAAGVTTLALTPNGSGFPGQGALLDLTGKTRDTLVTDDAAFIAVAPANNTKTKKLLKETFEKAKKLVAERKKPKTPAKKPGSKTPKKPGDKTAAKKPAAKTPKKKEPPKPTPKPGPTPPKPTPKPTPKPGPAPPPKPTGTKAPSKPAAKPKPVKKDPNLEVLADLLEGKKRAFLTLRTATDVLHYLDAVGDTRFKTTIIAARASSGFSFGGRSSRFRPPARSATAGTLAQVADKIKSLKASVLMQPELMVKPYTNHLINPAANLRKAGVEVGFPIGDSKAAVKKLFESLITLVRHGLDADAALAGVTLVPAKMLGVADRVGSIKAGKEANLILWSADPLDPVAKIETVWFKGTEVKKENR